MKKELFFLIDEFICVYMKIVNVVGERDFFCSMLKVLIVSVVFINGIIFYNFEL